MARHLNITLPEIDEEEHDLRSSYDHAEKAFNYITMNRLSPNPKNYSIWYYYVAGTHPELRTELNALAKKKQISDETIDEFIYARFTPGSSEASLKQATSNTQSILGGMLQSVSEFDKKHTESSQQMDSHIKELADAQDNEGVKVVADKLGQSASAMVANSKTLSEQLEASRQEVAVLREQLMEVSHESQRDFLTGVYNRKALDEYLEAMIEKSHDEGETLSILMVDIDHFKQFNDTHGHAVGDEVIKTVAKSLKHNVKGRDFVARYGGEEFVIILAGTLLDDAITVAQNIRSFVAKRSLKHKEQEDYGRVSVSIGVSHLKPTDTAELLLKRADEAMYQAKKMGRNAVCAEDPSTK